MVRRTVSDGGIIHSGVLTELTIDPVSIKITQLLCSHNRAVFLTFGCRRPRCGIASTFGWQSVSHPGNRSHFLTFRFDCVKQGSCLTSLPRAKLRMITPSFILENSGVTKILGLIILRNMQCNEIGFFESHQAFSALCVYMEIVHALSTEGTDRSRSHSCQSQKRRWQPDADGPKADDAKASCPGARRRRTALALFHKLEPRLLSAERFTHRRLQEGSAMRRSMNADNSSLPCWRLRPAY